MYAVDTKDTGLDAKGEGRVDSEKCTTSGLVRRGWSYGGRWAICLFALCVPGCSDSVRTPTAEQLAAFQRTAPIEPTVDTDRIQKARLYTGLYRVVPGDVLEFTMPAVLRAVTVAEAQAAQFPTKNDQPYLCRVGPEGRIHLPAVGGLVVAGQSLTEIEAKVTDAYRRRAVEEPAIFVRVSEYRTAKVYIAGAVKKPGVYTAKSDEMTLVSLLTQAEGISETGAALVRIVRSKDQGAMADSVTPDATTDHTVVSPAEAGIVLPVVGMNIPFCDVALEEGDTVVVEQGRVPVFSVLGLVTRPGNFPCPSTTEYTLVQAIAFAGGLDPVTDPRYATIYRRMEDGAITGVPLRLVQDGKFTEVLSTPIKAGDVVAIEHTPRTRTKAMLHDLVRINTGLYLSGSDLWGRN
jgi:protein involved in polysaccharide export with SLBB domain